MPLGLPKKRKRVPNASDNQHTKMVGKYANQNPDQSLPHSSHVEPHLPQISKAHDKEAFDQREKGYLTKNNTLCMPLRFLPHEAKSGTRINKG